MRSGLAARPGRLRRRCRTPGSPLALLALARVAAHGSSPTGDIQGQTGTVGRLAVAFPCECSSGPEHGVGAKRHDPGPILVGLKSSLADQLVKPSWEASQ